MYQKLPVLITLFLFCSVLSSLSQSTDTSDSEVIFPKDVEITWSVQSNYLEGGDRFRSILTILNKDESELKGSGWTLYFNFLGMINHESLPPEVNLSHINGNFYKLEPTSLFEPLQSGEQFAIPFEASGSAVKKADAPSGLYFVHQDGEEIISVSDVEVSPFTEEKQIKRDPADNMPLPDAGYRYKQNASLSHLPTEDINQILPTPKSAEKGEGSFNLNKSIEIGYKKELENEAEFLIEQLTQVSGEDITATEGTSPDSDFLLTLDPDKESPEAYELIVTTDQIRITGADRAGVFYGIQSLRALLPSESFNDPKSSIEIDAQQIKDAPRFGYRGLHLDVSRNFQSASTVKKLLDVMAFYKLNTFHFHLTDDEGWRLPVEELPELTAVGGRRGHTTTERDYMIPSYGSGPNPDPEISSGSGSYNRETFIEILQYAAERHIEVMPEIDVPGHARAAIVAMKSRHNKYLAEDMPEEANRYRLHEPEDESQYRSVQNWDDNVINVCQSSTYRFMETVVDEIIAMYDEAGAPLTTIHMGGDEVPHGAWEKSPACQELIQNTAELDSVDDLPDYFFERLRKMLAERDLIMAGWEEIALDETESGSEPDPDFAGYVQPYVWASVWESGSEEHSYKLANAGYEVVMSHASNFYFDLAYNKHPEEPGLYWAGFVDVQDPYSFIPFDLYKNAEKNLMGNPIPDSVFAEATTLTETGRDNILGLQGQLWGEMLTSQDRVEYMALPRLLGLAERAWAQQPDWAAIEDRNKRRERMNEDWNEFANRLGQQELPRMDSFHGGFNYRLPPPGAAIEDGVFKANVEYPGLTIRYTLDGGEPSASSNKYTKPVVLEGNRVVKVRTFSSDGRGSRTVTIGGNK